MIRIFGVLLTVILLYNSVHTADKIRVGDSLAPGVLARSES
jgi:hypothetical protein